MSDKKNNKENNKDRKQPFKDNNFSSGGGLSVFWVFLLVLGAYYLFSFSGNIFFDNATKIEYTTFREQVKNGNVEKVLVRDDRISGELIQSFVKTTEKNDTVTVKKFYTYIPSFGDDEILAMLEENNVTVNTLPKADTDWWTTLIWMIPLAFMIFIGLRFYKGMQQRGQNFFNIGQSKAKLYDQTKEKTTFDDVAGADGAKTELAEVIEFLKTPDKFKEIGAKIPKGVLMVGPPGTGKTLLARAVAGEAEVPFFIITGSDFMEMFVGVGAKRVRDMFEKAKEKSPSIIFIDELDSIGRRRGAGVGGGHDEREQTLNQLLSEMDGFEPHESVIVMAATNRPDILDKALLRPGRFDRQITVDNPTKSARLEILKIHAKNKKFSDEVDFDEIARSTPGFSGADLENLLNESALYAAREDRKVVIPEDVEQARDKIMMGLKREGMALDDETKKLLAYHEAGHALVAASLPNADPVHKVTIIPRGRAMGVTQQLPEEDKYLYKKEYMTDRLAVMMGGRAAENLIFDTSTSGAENDLKQSTKIARKMVLDWGMSDAFKNVAYGEESEQVFLGKDLSNRQKYSEETGSAVDKSIRAILEEAYLKAESILKENRDVLDKIADLLIEKEQVSGKKVVSLLNGEGNELLENGQEKTADLFSESDGDGEDTEAGRTETAETDENKKFTESDENVDENENENEDDSGVDNKSADAKPTSSTASENESESESESEDRNEYEEDDRNKDQSDKQSR